MDYSQTERISLMKYFTLILSLLITVGITSCAKNPASVQVTPNSIQSTDTSATRNQVINTKMGQLTISSARIVDEINGDKPNPGEKILLIILGDPSGEALKTDTFSLEEFQNIIPDPYKGTIHILGNDGSETISNMAGWLGPEYKEFGIGFRMPDAINTYQLFGPGMVPLRSFLQNNHKILK
jgi:hypothetical protein